MRWSLISITLALLLAACATGGDVPSTAPADTASKKSDMALSIDQDIWVERSGDTVIYRGRLTEPGLDALRNASGDPQVTTLLIESAGGEIVVGMDFGNWVAEHELDVVVDHACLSSCANYVFTAGRQKEIRPGAVVAWHGSAKQPGLLEQLHQLVEEDIASRGLPPREQQRELKRARRANVSYLTGAIRKQDEFFFRVGVDEYVTRVGNDRYGIRGFFYLSVEDMAEFGIENVTADENYADMEPRALARRIGFPVTLIRLE
ncbi:MAG: hypothetical protein JSU95_05680 [Betaproteobacteria bacterium]|nr:MAG: hypothetical protein JSU95_05680 [Betaproteobacteria bacterium]